MPSPRGAAGDAAEPDPRGEATLELVAWSAGDPAARDRLLERVYAELRAQAAAYLARERAGHTLQPTALVHEAWVRLIRSDDLALESRGHFLAIAARAMRQVLVDHARTRLRDKRGAGAERVELATNFDLAGEDGVDRALTVLTLEEGLAELRAVSERLVQVVELRFYGGLTTEEAAAALGVSVNTAERDWRVARAWLAQRLDGARDA